LGLRGMPRRIYTYQPEMPWSGLNIFISLSAIILAIGFLLFFIDAIRSAKSGPVASGNPWGATTLEWATSSPPPPYNFARLPVVGSLKPLTDHPGALPVASGLRVDRRELLVSSVVQALPEAREP
ncbi:cytochrome ubiquinol oxidase subunit I, partial [Mesorhizobium sp. M2E.F.Ca.ET.154.01.1.1]